MNVSKWKRGNELHPDDQADVLRAYIYRETVENIPPIGIRDEGTAYPSDAEWLKTKWFAVRKDGRLNQRSRGCLSFNPEVNPNE